MNTKGQSTLGKFKKILNVKNYYKNTINGYIYHFSEFIDSLKKPALHITSKEVIEYIVKFQ